MKAIVIENECEIDFTIEAFLKDNPDLFESVFKLHFANHASNDNIASQLRGRDAVIASSTWIYKDQLNDYLKMFLQIPRKFNFFIHDFTTKLNEWSYDTYDYRDKENRKLILELFKKEHNIQFFCESDKGEIKDRLNLTRQSHLRHLYQCYQLKYSEEHDLFYTDNFYTTLEDEIENKEKAKK